MDEVGLKELIGIGYEDMAQEVENFEAGSISKYIHKWKNITSDKRILDTVEHGLKLEFTGKPPAREAFEFPRPSREWGIINTEIKKLLKKKVIEPCQPEQGEYYSNLFTAEKKDGTFRTILNLKFLNKECDKAHFKMESLKQALNMVKPGAFLASIDIKDAFYSVRVCDSHKKYLRFMWDGQPYQFRSMPNGYVDAMRMFTKLLKPVLSSLRKMGYESVIYVDDLLLQGDTYKECLKNVLATLDALRELGFVIHIDKSVLIPTRILIFLGFIINTIDMTVTLTDEKKIKIITMAKGLRCRNITCRMISSFIGNLTAAFEGIPEGRLYYRHLEHCKTTSLKRSGFNFDAECTLDARAWEEIDWWIHNIPMAFAHIRGTPEIDYTIYTDASKHNGGGWGASDGVHEDINGRWTMDEQQLDINCLELMAIKLAIQAYLPVAPSTRHVRIMSDNTSAIAYINKKGGTHCMTINDMAVEIWEFCISAGAHISAAHIPGKHNIIADNASRQFQDAAEWMLSPEIFEQLVREHGMPDIDLFASRLNHQTPVYASWKPDPNSTFIDAMSIEWKGFIYLFPPFSMVWAVVNKLVREKKVTKAILVVSDWTTQSWYPRVMRMATAWTTISSSALILPGTSKCHPMAPKLRLVAVLIN